MKFDQIADVDSLNFNEISRVFNDDDLIFTAASIHPGEPEIMLNAFCQIKEKFPKLKMIMVPRHVEKKDYFCDTLNNYNISYISLSDLRLKKDLLDKKDVLLVDTTGEMMSILANSDIVYVGKSLGGNQGGHNIIEPAIFGKPIIFGENMQNFRLVVTLFKQAKAVIEVADEKQFIETLENLVSDNQARERLAIASRNVVKAQRGAIDKTIDLLIEK